MKKKYENLLLKLLDVIYLAFSNSNSKILRHGFQSTRWSESLVTLYQKKVMKIVEDCIRNYFLSDRDKVSSTSTHVFLRVEGSLFLGVSLIHPVRKKVYVPNAVSSSSENLVCRII